MDSADAELPDIDGLSIAELKALVQEQHAQLVATHAELLSNTLLVETLKLEILKLRRLQFGRRSEKRERQIEQLELWVEELEAADAQLACVLPERPEPAAAACVPKPRREFPAHLERETQTIAPDHEACPDCGGALKYLGEDVSEMLELEPVRFKVIRQVRPKLACASCDTIVQASAPTRPIERGMAGPGLLAHVLVDRGHELGVGARRPKGACVKSRGRWRAGTRPAVARREPEDEPPSRNPSVSRRPGLSHGPGRRHPPARALRASAQVVAGLAGRSARRPLPGVR